MPVGDADSIDELRASLASEAAQLQAVMVRIQLLNQKMADIGQAGVQALYGSDTAGASGALAMEQGTQQVLGYATLAAPSGSLTMTDNTASGGTITVVLDPTKIQDTALASALVLVLQGFGVDKGPELRAAGAIQPSV